jgi:purine nucleosidase
MIIDTDAGVDDAQAIMLALADPDVTVEAITTVTGNVHVDHVTRNVVTVLDLMGADAPVYRGADYPLIPGFWEAEARIHGEDGLGNLAHRPPSSRPIEPEPAAVALVQMANNAPGAYTLVTLGPLTNIALACKLDPSFPAKIKQFVFMGGTISALGNVAKGVTAEFNFYCDPEAALITLDAFPESTMLSWETTLKHPFTWEQYDALAAIDSAAGQFFRDTTYTTVLFLRQHLLSPGYLLPDPLAMAITLDPGLIHDNQHHYVTVEVQGRATRGQAVVDYLGLTGRDPNVHVISDLDIDGVYAMFEQALA